MTKLETYRIDHPLFEGIAFDCPERAREAAVRLAEFLIRKGGDREADVSITVFSEEDGVRDWFHHDTIEACLEVSGGRF